MQWATGPERQPTIAYRCRRGVREGRSGADKTWERSAARLVEEIPQPVLGGPLREVAEGRPPTVSPPRPKLLLHLTAVRESILGLPTRPALDPEDAPVGCRSSIATTRHRLGTIGDTKRFAESSATQNPVSTGLTEWAVKDSNLQPWD
jgi:hypothetical protein